jgi:YegS/Rv2252/BmrU family lipid kinase
VIAFGGDGTISEVADGLLRAGSDTHLGIISRGTGGDFRRGLDIPSDIFKAAKRIRTSMPRHIDVGRVTFSTGEGGHETRHFVNLASFGFSSDVARRANSSTKKMGGKVSFLTAAIRTLASYDNAEVAISVDGGPKHRLTLLLGAIGNGRFFGGGMKICPTACLDDGHLDLVTVGDLGRLEVLAKIHRIYSGTHLDMKQVKHTRCHFVDVSPWNSKEKIPVEIDGETPGTLPARFEILKNALPLRL